MSSFPLLIVASAILIHLLRQYLSDRVHENVISSVPFSGKILQAGDTVVAVREAAKEGSQNHKTIVCFPGFLETSSYFLDLYGALDCELIFVNNANYHSPFASANIESLAWPTNPYQSGSIEYDGFHLALAVKNLASHEHVVVHGHSRGGAVVLDAGRQFPDITNDSARNITAVLEAAVLPQAKAAGGTPGPIRAALMAYLMPFMFSCLRGLPAAKIVRFPMMKPNNPHKTDVLQYLFKSAKQIKTLVANMLSLAEWQKNQTVDVFKNYQTIKVLIGEVDSVLDNASMIESAERGRVLNAGLDVIQTSDTNHFISLEQADAVRRAVLGLQE